MDELASEVDRLSSDMVRIQELLLTLQPGAGGGVADIRPDPSLGDVPGTDDVLSLAASANLFSEGVTGEEASNAFGEAPAPLLRALGTAQRVTPSGPSSVRPWLAWGSMLLRQTWLSLAPFSGAALPQPLSLSLLRRSI